jgi:hypothetical protein
MGMGEQKKRAKAFEQKTAKTKEAEIYQETLFSGKQVESEITLECFRKGDSDKVKIGKRVKLIDMGDSIDVFIAVSAVGSVVSSQISELRRTLKLHKRKSRSVAAEIIEVSDLTPTFIVRVG